MILAKLLILPYQEELTGSTNSIFRTLIIVRDRIIRDMKTVNGPKNKQRGERHRRAIFDELQLALYAKVLEEAYPDDRVIGVGLPKWRDYGVLCRD